MATERQVIEDGRWQPIVLGVLSNRLPEREALVVVKEIYWWLKEDVLSQEQNRQAPGVAGRDYSGTGQSNE